MHIFFYVKPWSGPSSTFMNDEKHQTTKAIISMISNMHTGISMFISVYVKPWSGPLSCLSNCHMK